MKLDIIVTTHNSSRVINNCLNKINFTKYQVFVVDNASSDNTLEIVRNNFPQVKIIANNKNWGYGRGNNLALKQVDKPFALILNPDCFIFEDDLAKVIAMMEANSQIAIGAPLVLNYYPLQEADKLQEIAVVEGNINGDIQSPNSHIKFVKYIMGACIILRMEFFKQVGFFDEKIFLYYEDDEICFRASQHQKICAINIDALAYHIGQGSSGNNWRGIYRRFWHRALSKFYWKEKQKGFAKAYFSAFKLTLSFAFQTIFYGIIFNKKQFFKNLGSTCGSIAYLLRLTAFDNNDNPRG